LITHALKADISETKIKQGGDRYLICPGCGKTHVHRKTYKKIVLVCDECNHISIIEDTQVTIDYPNATWTKEQAEAHRKTQRNITSNPVAEPEQDMVIPPCQDSKQDAFSSDISIQQAKITIDPPLVAPLADIHHDEIAAPNLLAAAQLLLEIAGQHNRHITMPPRHPKKYLEVKRVLTLQDVIEHLQAGEAKGAPCSYADNQTRALCWDGDNPEHWQILMNAMKELVSHGYYPLLEQSPHRGGHGWIIYSGLVDASAARAEIYRLVPALRELAEAT